MDQIVQREGRDKGTYRVGCDVGGTFTDLCFLEEQTGKLHVVEDTNHSQSHRRGRQGD